MMRQDLQHPVRANYLEHIPGREEIRHWHDAREYAEKLVRRGLMVLKRFDVRAESGEFAHNPRESFSISRGLCEVANLRLW